MNPGEGKAPQTQTPSQSTNRTSGSPKKNMNLDLKKVLPKLKKSSQKLVDHLSFIAIMFVLLVYLLVVWQIRGLVIAEPTAEDESLALASANVSKIDKAAIEQILSLEQNSPKIKTLLDEARNNPFHE